MSIWAVRSFGITLLALHTLFAMENDGPILSPNLKIMSQQELNMWVSHQGAEIYHLLNNDERFGYPTKGNYYTNSKHWFMRKPYGEPTVSLVKKQGVLASQALQDLLSSPGRFDCRIAQRIVYIECVRRLIGNECFDNICQEFEKEPAELNLDFTGGTKSFIIDLPMYANPYLRLASFKSGTLYSARNVGYFGYTPNIPEYAFINFKGDLRGDHGLLCSNAKNTLLYAGYGSFYKEGPQSWEEMKKRFRQETLAYEPPSEPIIDTSKIREERKDLYIKHMKAIHESNLQQKVALVDSLKETYDDKFTMIQFTFCEAKSFYLDLDKIRQMISQSIPQNAELASAH